MAGMFDAYAATEQLRELVKANDHGSRDEVAKIISAARQYHEDMTTHMNGWTVGRKALADKHLWRVLHYAEDRLKSEPDRASDICGWISAELDGVVRGLDQAEERKDWSE